MTFTAVTESSLLQALARGETVVLPNRRAARTLRQAFDDRQRAHGLRAWEAAGALAWTDWTHTLWSGLAIAGRELRLLLNPAQEHSLWREIVEASTAGRTLNSPDALAGLARTAWALAAAHNAVGRIRATANTFDSRTFAAWAESFARTLADESCLSAAMREDALREHALAGALRLERPVVIAGFEEPTPAQAALLQALRRVGANLSETRLEPKASPALSRVSTVAATPRDELIVAARWIRTLFNRRTAEAAPPRIAVLLSRPDESRADIESVFREVLAPELQPISADVSATPWEFATGAPLLAQPMIVDALALLQLVQGPLPIQRLGALLHSPFIGAQPERLPAARFDAQVLRRSPSLLPEFDLEALTRLVRLHARSGRAPAYQPGWLTRLNDLRSLRLRSAAARSYAEWSELIRDLLRAANWPGDRTPTAVEFATGRAWEGTLDLLATLDFRGMRVSFSTAMSTLEHLLQTVHLSPPPAHAPVQIMRPDEAEGSLFDATVLLHATDENFPEPSRPHPLLGWALQQELGLTDAAQAAERNRARAESLIRRSPALLVLRAAGDEQGPLRPSPLLQQFGITEVAAAALLPAPSAAAPVEPEIVPDDIALPPLPSPELRGGASVLRLQAACGFLAFAELRLHATMPDACELGLDAGERGNLVHRALESFWKTTGSQAELRGLSAAERAQRIDNAIDAAFARFAPPAGGWSAAYLRAQRERLRRLLARWLDFELQRGPFTVQKREERTSIPVGPLRLKVQPDRIDEVEDGVVLVDYKTGHRAHPSQWLGDRPDNPQLPLYAITQPGRLQALLFARLRPGSEMRWLGLAASQSVLPSAPRQRFVDLELRRDEWRTVLTHLADDFASGRADVSPKSFTLNCDGCRQRLLCRVDPAALAAATADERDADEETDA